MIENLAASGKIPLAHLLTSVSLLVFAAHPANRPTSQFLTLTPSAFQRQDMVKLVFRMTFPESYLR